MKIGYACICLGDETYKQCTCTQKYANEERLKQIIAHNLQTLRKILIYNVSHGILLFRISSDLIPFGSSPINTLPWKQLYAKELCALGDVIRHHHLRVSMHPGQYTIINAKRKDVVARSILDLQYHSDVLDAMNLDSTHKIILHIGGVYDDKETAIERFIQVYQSLSKSIQNRLVIENDDRYYTIEDVLYIASKTNIPVIFDNLHHAIHPPNTKQELSVWLDQVKQTWHTKDGHMKVHYSEQASDKRLGAHAQRISIDKFLSFAQILSHDVDIMLEVKDKNFSACKAHYLLDQQDDTFYGEWRFYRYLFYLHSIAYYGYYDVLFQEGKYIDRYLFYQRVEEFFDHVVTHESYRTLMQFMKDEWYHMLTSGSKKRFDRCFQAYIDEQQTALQTLNVMYRMVVRERIEDAMYGLYLLLKEV